MDIFKKTKDLKLPKETYVVVGGGVLVGLGILPWDGDIDLAILPEDFNKLKAIGWEEETWQGKPVLKHDVYDAGVGFAEWSLHDLQADAMLIKGVPFMSLGKLLLWKKRIGREKDLRHIALIEGYIANNKIAKQLGRA